MSEWPDAECTSVPNGYVLSLPKVVEMYSNALPLTVRMKSGFGSNTRISSCERLTILEASGRQVVAAETIEGEEFYLPLNTATKLSLLYNPTGDIKEAVQGFVFKTVSDLKDISPRPRLVCTKTSWKGPVNYTDEDEEESLLVDANEIVVLLDEETDASGQSGLLVFSMKTRSSKFLPDDCAPVFTTAGSRLSLHLPDYLAYVPRPFPCEACIVKSNKCYANNVVALTALTTTTVLKCEVHQGQDESPPLFYYVPSNHPGVEVVVERERGGETREGQTPSKDALTGELTGQLVEESTFTPSQLPLMGESTGPLTGGITCGRDDAKAGGGASDHLYETIPDLPARGRTTKSLERSHTHSSHGSLKHQNSCGSSLDRVSRSFEGDSSLTRSSSASPHHGQPSPVEGSSDPIVVNRRPSRRGSCKGGYQSSPSNRAGQLNAVTGQISHSWV